MNRNDVSMWSPRQHCYIAVSDGVTTTGDVGAALAHGGQNEVLAAEYWVLAGEHLLANADAKLQQALAAYRDLQPGDDLDAAHRALRAQDDYELARWTRDELAGAAALVESQQWSIEQAWRTGARTAYRDYVLEYGNDGRPEDDRSLSARERARLERAVTVVAQATGASPDRVRAQIQDAAYAHGSDPGTDADPDRFAPPDWVIADPEPAESAPIEGGESVDPQTRPEGDPWAPGGVYAEAVLAGEREDLARAERAQAEWEHTGDQELLWGELGACPPPVRAAFWATRDKAGRGAGLDINPAELGEAYTDAGLPVPKHLEHGVASPHEDWVAQLSTDDLEGWAREAAVDHDDAGSGQRQEYLGEQHPTVAEIQPEAGGYGLYLGGAQVGRFPSAEDAELVREILTRRQPLDAADEGSGTDAAAAVHQATTTLAADVPDVERPDERWRTAAESAHDSLPDHSTTDRVEWIAEDREDGGLLGKSRTADTVATAREAVSALPATTGEDHASPVARWRAHDYTAESVSESAALDSWAD